jgi:pimeloyl-ACP methyl ester carboxylesterase
MAQGKYANVNGLKMYYEVYGIGQPLILLHGGLGTIGMFEQILPDLAENRQVIGVELQAHGHTADIERPISFEALADDIAALIKHLGFEKTDILGYSLGGGTALQTTIRHPGVVRSGGRLNSMQKRWLVPRGPWNGVDECRSRQNMGWIPNEASVRERRAQAGKLAGVGRQAG